MAAKNFRSTLLEPTSEFAHGDRLRFTALSTSGSVFNSSFSETVIGDNGQYSVDLQYGKYRIDYKPYEGVWQKFADVEVSESTLATSLQALALSSKPVTDDTILTLQSLLADAEKASTEAQAASVEAVSAADESTKNLNQVLNNNLSQRKFVTTADYSSKLILMHRVDGDPETRDHFFGRVSAYRVNGFYRPFDCLISSQKNYGAPDSAFVYMQMLTSEFDDIYLCYCVVDDVKYIAMHIGETLSSFGQVVISGAWTSEPAEVIYAVDGVVINQAVSDSIVKIEPLTVAAEQQPVSMFESEKAIALQIMDDYQLGLYSITEQDITDTRLYIQSIEPLSAASSQRAALPRPQIFIRYKANPYEL